MSSQQKLLRKNRVLSKPDSRSHRPDSRSQPILCNLKKRSYLRKLILATIHRVNHKQILMRQLHYPLSTIRFEKKCHGKNQVNRPNENEARSVGRPRVLSTQRKKIKRPSLRKKHSRHWQTPCQHPRNHKSKNLSSSKQRRRQNLQMSKWTTLDHPQTNQPQIDLSYEKAA